MIANLPRFEALSALMLGCKSHHLTFERAVCGFGTTKSAGSPYIRSADTR